MTPGTTIPRADRLLATGALSVACRKRNWRWLWDHGGPLALIAFALGMLLGSWAVLIAREIGG